MIPFFTSLSNTSRSLLSAHDCVRQNGRILTCGFTQLQRIAGGAHIGVWSSREEDIFLPLQWAAIRQVELLQESDHYALFDMKAEEFALTFRRLNASRSGGYRLVIVTAGCYQGGYQDDQQAAFDWELEQKLQQISNLLWLDDVSRLFSRCAGTLLLQPSWDIKTLLPHVGCTLNAMQIYNRVHAKERAAMTFLDAVNRLPRQRAVDHNVFVGLKLPKHQAENDVDWGPAGPFGYLAFRQALYSLFSKFDLLSLESFGPQGEDGTRFIDTAMPHVRHFRGYGDHMRGCAHAELIPRSA